MTRKKEIEDAVLELDAAIRDDNQTAGVTALLALFGGLLSDVARIADTLEDIRSATPGANTAKFYREERGW